MKFRPTDVDSKTWLWEFLVGDSVGLFSTFIVNYLDFCCKKSQLLWQQSFKLFLNFHWLNSHQCWLSYQFFGAFQKLTQWLIWVCAKHLTGAWKTEEDSAVSYVNGLLKTTRSICHSVFIYQLFIEKHGVLNVCRCVRACHFRFFMRRLGGRLI